MINKFKNLIRRKKLIDRLPDLAIEKSGVDSEGDPFVKLMDGTMFFGHGSQYKYDKLLYKWLPLRTRKVLSVEAIQVALDIIIRYEGGGLKYGGPEKQSRYQVRSGDFVSEMGAYQGFYSIKLAKQVGEKGKVICIEPIPDNFRLLKKNMEFNDFKNVICVNKAVWHEQKKMMFSRRKNDGQSSSIEIKYNTSEAFSVQADSLDGIFQEIGVKTIDFMIIQLNGAEINGLQGLTSFSPKNFSIAARYDTKGVDAAMAIKNLLEEKNYKVEIEDSDFVFATLK